MAQTKIKAGLFEGIIGNGTDGYYLMSNGDGTMTWSSVVINPTITDVDYPGTATAADPAGGETITLTGTGFKTGATVTVGGTSAPAVSYVSETQITFTTPAKAAGDYDIVVTNTDTGSATFINGISFNGIPSWTTAAGSLGTFASNTTISTITLQATEPDAGTITFNITNGALPTGLSLTGANIDGTTSILNADTLYTFTVTATDDENQVTPRTFTITVQKEFISSENFTINTYTGNGSTQSIEGKIGTAADFNGSSSRIDLNDDGIGASGTTRETFSVSLWVKITTATQSGIISDYISPNFGFAIQLETTGRLSAWNQYTGSNVSSTGTTAINDGSWHHLLLINNTSDNTQKLYIDNTLEIDQTLGTGTKTSSNIQVGYYNISGTPNYFFNGKIDQIRLFNKALSSSEVTTLYGESNTSTTKSTTDIFADGSGVALYEFEKGAIDTGGTSGYIGSGGIFNGSSSYIQTSSNPIGTLSEFSISVWFQLDNVNTLNHLVCNYDNSSTSDRKLLFRANNTTLEATVYSSSGTGTSLSGTYTLTTGTWYHVCLVVGSSTMEIFLDGTSIGSTSLTVTPNTSCTEPIVMGTPYLNNPTSSYFLDGKIDQVRLFNKALSSSEVTTLYGETSASATKSTTDIFNDGSGVALYELEGNANNSAEYVESVETTNLKINLNTLVDDSYTSGSTWYDLTSNNNDGTINGATLDATDNGSLKFGSGDYVNIPDTADIVNANFTIEVWFKLDSTTNQWNALVGKGTGDNSEELTLLVRPGNNVIYLDWGTLSQYVQPSYTWAANTWYHLAMTFGTNGIYFWVNGQKITGQSSNPGSTTSLTDDLRIGSARNNTISMYGNISQFRYYDAVLSDATILSNYNASFNPSFYNGTATNVSYAYDGTPTNVSFVGTSFQPDLVWTKRRDTTGNHLLYDSIRGAGYYISSNLTNSQNGSAQLDTLASFDSNGFTVGTSAGSNASGGTFVAWCWKAASSDSTNTDGSITSTVRANQDAGFSVVKYTGNGTAGATIGHGLSSTPEMVIVKAISGTDAGSTSWHVYTPTTGATKTIMLNSSAAASTNSLIWNNTAPTSTVFSVSNNTETNGTSSQQYIAYCFHSVSGYQKIGSYTGTGGANTINTGFAPRFLLIKRTDSTSSWRLYDRARDSGSLPERIDFNLNANLNGAEYNASSETYAYAYFGTNGFYFVAGQSNVDINGNGGSYIYLAIA